MIFSELYSVYYNTVAKIIGEAVKSPVSTKMLREIVSENAFSESLLTIEPGFEEGRWQLLKDGKTNIKHEPKMPFTLIEKRWIRALMLDPRVRLFTDDLSLYENVKPLFTRDDYMIFDSYSDGDDYEDEDYRKNFRLIRDAIHGEYPVKLVSKNRYGKTFSMVMLPKTLEYSEKDDKFRVIGRGAGRTVNLGRIISCERYFGTFSPEEEAENVLSLAEFELIDERNALERVMTHFAHFEKEVEKLDEKRYHVRVKYDPNDETELVIRFLSFGPVIKVLGPDRFAELIKERLICQKQLTRLL